MAVYAVVSHLKILRLFLRIVGVVTQLLISILTYRTFRKFVTENTAFVIAVFYYNIIPKNSTVPDFSNMLLWFSTLVFLSFLEFSLNRGTSRHAILPFPDCRRSKHFPSCASLSHLYFRGTSRMYRYLAVICCRKPSEKSSDLSRDLWCLRSGLVGLLFVSYVFPAVSGWLVRNADRRLPRCRTAWEIKR